MFADGLSDSPHSSVDEPEPTENVENNLAKGLPFATSSSIETEAAERDKNDMNGDQGDNDGKFWFSIMQFGWNYLKCFF